MGRLLARPGLARAAVLGGAVALLLLVVGIASRDRDGTDGGDGRTGAIPIAVLDYAVTLVLLFLLVGAGVIVWALTARGGGDLSPVRRWRAREMLVLAAACALLLVAAQGMRRPQPPPPDEHVFGSEQQAETLPQPPQAQAQPAPEERGVRFKWEVFAAAGALGVGIVGVYLVRRRRAPAHPPQRDVTVADELTSAVSDAIDDLEQERDARRAVIAAYARMEATLGEHGFPRRPSEAPLEYLSRVLLALRVRAAAVLDLTDLFERAKFSRHTIDAEMKREAIAALVAVRDDLRAAS